MLFYLWSIFVTPQNPHCFFGMHGSVFFASAALYFKKKFIKFQFLTSSLHLLSLLKHDAFSVSEHISIPFTPPFHGIRHEAMAHPEALASEMIHAASETRLQHLSCLFRPSMCQAEPKIAARIVPRAQ